jgi:hypothetical protein
MIDRDPHKAVDYIINNAKHFAKAKAERTYIEHYRKSLKAILMKRTRETTIGGQEREAYADPKYVQHLTALQAAVEQREKARWLMIAAQARVEAEKANLYANGRTDRAMQ